MNLQLVGEERPIRIEGLLHMFAEKYFYMEVGS